MEAPNKVSPPLPHTEVVAHVVAQKVEEKPTEVRVPQPASVTAQTTPAPARPGLRPQDRKPLGPPPRFVRPPDREPLHRKDQPSKNLEDLRAVLQKLSHKEGGEKPVASQPAPSVPSQKKEVVPDAMRAAPLHAKERPLADTHQRVSAPVQGEQQEKNNVHTPTPPVTPIHSAGPKTHAEDRPSHGGGRREVTREELEKMLEVSKHERPPV